MVFSSMEVRDVVSWNSFLSAYARNGYSIRVLGLFEEMDVKPDKVTYLAVLDACATMAALQRGKEIHHRIAVEDEQLLSDTMLGNSLLNMYGKCQSVDDAAKLFESIHGRRSVVTWTGMISIYAQNSHGWDALRLKGPRIARSDRPSWALEQRDPGDSVMNMYTKCGSLEDARSLRPDEITYLNVVTSLETPNTPLLDRVFARIVSNGLESNPFVGHALVSLHCRSGNLEQARKIFDLVERRRVVAWTAMLVCHNGHGSETVELLLELSLEGIEPDHITLLGVIFGCGNAGLLEDGLEYLTRICDDYGLIPQMNHYGCMVDLLGKAGWLSLLD
ncbi:pentatricopeptide repeat-containing protein At2g13600 [Selaginella moellendorffii]|uniref:pentatricopeptide repeat-containing protein At2g13600 n=1 Tax=Selaginella moellendorffii TaxID=88036 RepID=UPI000D1CBFAF|nr:pentatricopeptide repeat-containing protein At2g13600 [Selaginella moellendorffii]|eukprot:XP_024516777.1 pentatricopeptide repeat-containing protein At2g13600 [Selaginella moellendorffii]